MDEYKREYRKMETRYCNIHKDQVYSMTCKSCSQLPCANCVDELGDCSAGRFARVHYPIFILTKDTSLYSVIFFHVTKSRVHFFIIM